MPRHPGNGFFLLDQHACLIETGIMLMNLPRQFWGGIAFFFVFGAAYGLWGGHIASIEDQIGDSESAYGNALVGASIGLILSAFVVGPLSQRFGTSVVLRAAWVLYFIVMCGVFWVTSPWVLGMFMFGIGLMGGIIDVAVNAQIAVTERQTGRSLLSRAHATWSLGGLFGAGSAWIFLSFGVRDLHIIFGLVVLGLIALWGSFNLYTQQDEADESTAPEPEGRVDADDISGGAVQPWRSPILILMGFVALLGLLIESGMMDWTPIYFSDFRGSSADTSAAVFTSFSAVMFVTRMLGDTARDYVRDKHLLVGGALLSAVALSLGLLVENDLLAIATLSIGGLGIAFVYPLVTSRAAAYRAPGQTNTSAAGNIAVVTGIGYGALLVGPPIIGFVSENVSLLWGMAIVAACAPVMALLAMLLPRQSARVSTDA